MSPLLSATVGLLIGIGLAAGVLLRRRRPHSSVPETQTDSSDDQIRRLADAGRQLSSVAHELSNPLTAILAFSDDLLQAEPTVEQREALLVIRHQAGRSRALLRGLLEAVRGGGEESGTTKRRARVDPTALVSRVARVTERECEERGLDFDCVVVPSAPAIVGDAAGLEQVLSNLLQNACQATPRGGKVSLTVQLRGRLLEFVVRDNGPGIPSEIIPYIFEPFYSTKPDREGTGLGLSISQGIVRNHNGILTAENIPEAEGGGARFVVAMPFDDRRWRDRTAGPEAQQDVTASDRRAAPTGRRVLVAEDDVTVRQAVRRFLEHREWHVTEVEDGRAALAILLPEEGEAPFDAVVCDLHLPGVSGVVVYGRVCAESSRLRDRFLLMTGDGTNPIVTSFQARTHAEVLEKPFDLEVLAEMLERMVLR